MRPSERCNFYVVTFQSALYIGVPLLVMYVMLKYNIVETDSGTGRIIDHRLASHPRDQLHAD